MLSGNDGGCRCIEEPKGFGGRDRRVKTTASDENFTEKDMLTEETGEHFELYFARNVSTHIQMVLAAQKKMCLILLLYVCL